MDPIAYLLHPSPALSIVHYLTFFAILYVTATRLFKDGKKVYARHWGSFSSLPPLSAAEQRVVDEAIAKAVDTATAVLRSQTAGGLSKRD